MSAAPNMHSHRRNRSAAAIKSILPGFNHKRSSTSDDGRALAGSASTKDAAVRPRTAHAALSSFPMLPPDHPHAQRVLGEVHNQPNGPVSSLRKPAGGRDSQPRALHKKTLSAVSLRSLGREKTKAKEAGKGRHKDGQKDDSRPRSEGRMQKTKSSTSLSAVFSKGRLHRKSGDRAGRDKENTTPPSSASANPTPIWAEYTTQRSSPEHGGMVSTTLDPRSSRIMQQEIDRYSYKSAGPRNFGEETPSLYNRHHSGRSHQHAPRPSSWYLAAAAHFPVVENLSRKSEEKRQKARWPSAEEPKVYRGAKSNTATCASKEGSKVMAAVAAINSRSNPQQPDPESVLDKEKIDLEFEAVLDSRNINEDLRSKMRSLNTRVKADFISKNKIDGPKPTAEPAPRTSMWARPTTSRRATSDQSGDRAIIDADDAEKSPRPRSKTFTFSRGDKGEKHRSDLPPPDRSSRNYDTQKYTSSKSASSRSLFALAGSSFSHRPGKAPTPNEFVSYLRTVQKPELVEVSKIHKLRLLLRNETVGWVDAFIREGGMMEIVGLLTRLQEMEWREDHDDVLLHESLLCLKGLCTTSNACRKLCEIESTLFPSLLGMLFDKEHKGPSEFTTRGLIMSLLLVHLSSDFNSSDELHERAQTILKYMRGPKKPEEAQPVNFVLAMRQPRPYRIWCQEVANVTKEVFWIFIHHLNVIPLGLDPAVDNEKPPSKDGPSDYFKQNFPQLRAPVPAAPHVGGVEWDATNYISTHLDLMNGLLASLPTEEERNDLRLELRDSGFEKVMGGHLRKCKEKFYGAVHDGLKTWVRAAAADGWDVKDVRMGPPEDKTVLPKNASPKKKKRGVEDAMPPKIETPTVEIPKLDFSRELDDRLPKLGKEDASDNFWL